MGVKETILQLANSMDKFKSADVLNKLGGSVSRQYISRVISGLVREGVLVKSGTTRQVFYALPEKVDFLANKVIKRFINQDVEEHKVLSDLERQAPFLNNLSENVKSIFAYAFSEMLNNAIEHSESENIDVSASVSGSNLIFTVNDFGIGVFKNIMKKHKLKSELEAIQDLLKGKTTTAPKAHSGEGIFFTSKVADIFVLESFEYRLRVDNTIPDIFVERTSRIKKGTRVTFSIDISSAKHLNDVFKEFQSNPGEYAFDKTEIHIKLYTMGTVYVSRSQAKRILSGLDKFKSIVLDFDKVPSVGQAFADEIFRVFKNSHPDISIETTNMNDAVEFMISRVSST